MEVLGARMGHHYCSLRLGFSKPHARATEKSTNPLGMRLTSNYVFGRLGVIPARQCSWSECRSVPLPTRFSRRLLGTGPFPTRNSADPCQTLESYRCQSQRTRRGRVFRSGIHRQSSVRRSSTYPLYDLVTLLAH